jgi:hypothetical protein
MRGCGVGAAVFGWRWLLLYASPNTQNLITCIRITIGHRRIIGPKTPYLKSNNQNPRLVSSTSGHKRPYYTSVWMMPPNIKGPSPTPLPPWQPPFWHFELPSHRLYICVTPISPIQPSCLSAHHSTPLYLPLPTTTVWLRSHLFTAKQAHRRHGSKKERPR